MAPQSGQVQSIPLQVIPQKFSSIQSQHIMKPQEQFQQKGCSSLHVAQTYFSGRRRFLVLNFVCSFCWVLMASNPQCLCSGVMPECVFVSQMKERQ
jgi:hypothetical protein